MVLDLNPRPLERESPPITTRPGLKKLLFAIFLHHLLPKFDKGCYSQISLIGIDVSGDILTFVGLPREGLGQRRPEVHVGCMGRHSSDGIESVAAEPTAEALVVVQHHGQPEKDWIVIR